MLKELCELKFKKCFYDCFSQPRVFMNRFLFNSQQENPGKELFIGPASEFEKDMKLEAIDPKHPSYFCVVTVAEVKGARLRLHFDGWSESYDFWANANSEFIFPVNWCSKNGQTLHPPRSK